MRDDKNDVNHSEEYQFPKDEYLDHASAVAPHVDEQVMHNQASDEGSPARQKTGISSQTSLWGNKKVILALILVVLIILGLKWMHRRVTGPRLPEVTPAVTSMVVTPVPVQSSQQALTQFDAATTNNISEMQNQVSQLHDQLSAMVEANQQLTQSVSALATQVKLLTQSVQTNSQKLMVLSAGPHVHAKPTYQPPLTVYAIKAVVPGRAWLVGSDGTSTNVSVGDFLSNYYGSIRAIDADGGRVYTSSGKTIVYGATDS